MICDADLARCNQRPDGATIRFFASGMSCGGIIALSRLGAVYQVRVNWLTGGSRLFRSMRARLSLPLVPAKAGTQSQARKRTGFPLRGNERTRASARRAARGFTLIEVLVALSVVTVRTRRHRLADRRDGARRALDAGAARAGRDRACGRHRPAGIATRSPPATSPASLPAIAGAST